MYEALCGRPVVPRGLNLPDTLNAICKRAVLPLRTLTPSVPEELAWLVQRHFTVVPVLGAHSTWKLQAKLSLHTP